MIIRKASAGSGKTYTLASTYIRLLLDSDDRYAYRHILAVTFTNKATSEMKSRILRDLASEAESNPKARRILVDLLHDYSAFAVSTIDKFFQQAIRAFSREIGQNADYQVELDRDSLIDEAMDRILDSLDRNSTDTIAWITENMDAALSQGRKIDIEAGLHDMGKRLMSEERRSLMSSLPEGVPATFTKEQLSGIRKACGEVIRSFSSRASALGAKVVPGEKIRMPGKTAVKACPELGDLFDRDYRNYCTAWIVNGLVFSLGMAAEFQKGFDELVKEKNVMCLDESTRLLNALIDGSDAPFVYEKLGVRYENFLLDEFQDTSSVQWRNFLPLLRESDSRGGTSLIVGDVKQSIYRWRDSDWKLLDREVVREFPEADVSSLESNWRSARAIVEFNNGFFSYAAQQTGLSTIYSDVRQQVRSDEGQSGQVRVSFCTDQLEKMLDSIRSARDCGAGWSDIAVLVRGHKEGALVADCLVTHDIPVISDDSLRLKSSIVARRLVAILSCMDDKEDTVSTYLAESLGVVIPDTYHSLVDLCEDFIRQLKLHDPDQFRGETLFIQAFMDDLQSWTKQYGNSLKYYLRHWDESDQYIGSPEDASAIRIITVHKSKGLEFPYLIFPFADRVTMFMHETHWCRLDTAGTGLPGCMDGIYPVDLQKTSSDTCFSEDFLREERLQTVDNLNIFYVALTRAEKVLHIIADEPSKLLRESVAKGKPKDFTDCSEILFRYLGGEMETVIGDDYDFTRMKRRDAEDTMDFDASYPSFDRNGRLRNSSDASDYFDVSGAVGTEASTRLDGIARHNILSRVRCPEDLEASVDRSVREAELSSSRRGEVLDMLSGRIASRPEWFGSSCRVLNETSLLDTDGTEHRPDRVVIDGGRVSIIDYKFGSERPGYTNQVLRYCRIYKSMGYTDVRGYLWYVPEDKVVEV